MDKLEEGKSDLERKERSEGVIAIQVEVHGRVTPVFPESAWIEDGGSSTASEGNTFAPPQVSPSMTRIQSMPRKAVRMD